MTRSIMRAAGLSFAVLTTAAAASAQPDTEPPPSLPRCETIDAEIVSTISSATATPGDSFAFRVVERKPPRPNSPEIPIGAKGFGVVSYAERAHGSGSPGHLVIEPRFVRQKDGTHVPVMADPQFAEAFASGTTRNLNGALGFVPGLGLAVSGYNAMHKGRDIEIPPGTEMRLVVGDGLAQAQCFIPPPTDDDVR